jgi:hypothetical protein
MTLDGHLRRVLKDFDTLSLPSTTPTVSGPDADSIAAGRAQLPDAEVHNRRLIVYATGEPGEPPRLAWMIEVVGRDPATAQKVGHDTVIVDARTGEVLITSGSEPSGRLLVGSRPAGEHSKVLDV